jgi:DnaJ-class molecular chaperone
MANDKVWDKHKFSMHQWPDVATRNENIGNNKELCKRCDGTGNELFSMYRKCSDCNGTGIARKADNER